MDSSEKREVLDEDIRHLETPDVSETLKSPQLSQVENLGSILELDLTHAGFRKLGPYGKHRVATGWLPWRIPLEPAGMKKRATPMSCLANFSLVQAAAQWMRGPQCRLPAGRSSLSSFPSAPRLPPGFRRE